MGLGVAAVTVGQVSPERISTLRALMEVTVPLVSEGRFVDIEAYTRHNEAFHNALVDLAGTRPWRTRTGASGWRDSWSPAARRSSMPARRSLKITEPSWMAYERGNLPDAASGDQTAQREREGDHQAGDRRGRWGVI